MASYFSSLMVKLEENKFPATLEYTNIMFDAIGSFANYPARFAMANQWLTSPLIKRSLLSSKSTAAGLRTTTAVTMLKMV